MTSEGDIIADAIRIEGGPLQEGIANPGILLAALETIYMHGGVSSEDIGGDSEAPTGHFYRIERWIVSVDSQGFKDLTSFDTLAEAEDAFANLEDEFSKWDDDDGPHGQTATMMGEPW